MNGTLKTISTLLGIIVVVAGGIFWFAPQADVQAVSQRLQQHIDGDRMRILQEQIWRMEHHYKCRSVADCQVKMPQDVFFTYGKLVSEYQQIMARLKGR